MPPSVSLPPPATFRSAVSGTKSPRPSAAVAAQARGFTLLELMIVLLILGVFASIGALRIQGLFSGGDLALASRVVIGAVSDLRARAAATRQEQALTLDLDRSLLLREEGAGGNPPGPFAGPPLRREIPLPPGVRLQDVSFLGRGLVQEGEARIRFFPNGAVERALIHLRNDRDAAYTLEINPLTGHVDIHDRYVEERFAE